MRWLADILYLFIGLLYLPIALYQALWVGKNRRGWGERFGFVRRFDPTRRRIWIHAVSLGEINATPRLVEALQQRLSDIDIVFSTTTDTGYARAVQLYGPQRVFRFPLDFSLVVTRVLRRVQPSLIVLVELEVWYNLLRTAARNSIPVAVVNGRLTAHSARRFTWLGSVARGMFSRLTWVGAQDQRIADRFCKLAVAADRVEVTSSLKWDTAEVVDHVEGTASLAAALGIDRSRPVWVCGSTGPGEEAMILEVYRRLLAGTGGSAQAKACGSTAPLLIIVPRKPERFDEVAQIIERSGFVCIRRSRHEDGTSPEKVSDSAVVLGDTMGELRKFYSLADIVFVGRSLVPMGGSDPMEVAALGKPMVVGRYTENFHIPVETLRRADAIRIVESSEQLPALLSTMLADPKAAGERGSRARQVVLDNQGATRRTVERLVSLIDP